MMEGYAIVYHWDYDSSSRYTIREHIHETIVWSSNIVCPRNNSFFQHFDKFFILQNVFENINN